MIFSSPGASRSRYSPNTVPDKNKHTTVCVLGMGRGSFARASIIEFWAVGGKRGHVWWACFPIPLNGRKTLGVYSLLTVSLININSSYVPPWRKGYCVYYCCCTFHTMSRASGYYCDYGRKYEGLLELSYIPQRILTQVIKFPCRYMTAHNTSITIPYQTTTGSTDLAPRAEPWPYRWS